MYTALRTSPYILSVIPMPALSTPPAHQTFRVCAEAKAHLHQCMASSAMLARMALSTHRMLGVSANYKPQTDFECLHSLDHAVSGASIHAWMTLPAHKIFAVLAEPNHPLLYACLGYANLRVYVFHLQLIFGTQSLHAACHLYTKSRPKISAVQTVMHLESISGIPFLVWCKPPARKQKSRNGMHASHTSL